MRRWSALVLSAGPSYRPRKVQPEMVALLALMLENGSVSMISFRAHAESGSFRTFNDVLSDLL